MLSPVFLLVIISLIAYGWIARTVKREDKQQRAIRQSRAGQFVENASQKRTPGSQAKRMVWGVMSGIVWMALAIALTLLLVVVGNWNQYQHVFSGPEGR